MRRLTFCDIATFYCRTGGGVRTYYDAKLDWFRRQHRHRYVLIIPGKRSSRRALTPSVTLVEARGVGVTGPENPEVLAVARAHGATAAQVRLAWTLQRGPHVLAIPGTGDPDHLTANVAAAALRLSPDEMTGLESLPRGA